MTNLYQDTQSKHSYSHTSVLLDEVLNLLDPQENQIYLDATVGLGGHFIEIAKRIGKKGTLIGIDQDKEALEICQRKLQTLGFDCQEPRIHLVHNNFSNIQEILSDLGIESITGGILADIGVSSMQLDDAARGFSFLHDGPLDMRMNTEELISAETIINTYSEKEIADILYVYGEEKRSRQIAKQIVNKRPLKSTLQLAHIVQNVLRYSNKKRNANSDKSHPATRTFQALRIAVNQELTVLENFLTNSIKILAPKAKLVVISFHSLEDRLVKHLFKQWSSNCICPPKQPICNCLKEKEISILTKSPLQASTKETLANPRSRSAKLRAVEKI